MSLEYKREPLEEDEIQLLRKSCRSFDKEFIINLLLDTNYLNELNL